MEVKFKIAQSEDIEGIITLCNEVFLENTKVDNARKIFDETKEDPNNIYLVGTIEEKVVAHAKISIIRTMYEEMDTFAILNHVCVKEDYRRHNIATKMLDEIERLCKEKGCKTMKLWSNNVRVPAHTFYKKYGFVLNEAGFFFYEGKGDRGIMNIEKIYIGGWFQRTTLQLSEIYDFAREATSELKLDKKQTKKLHAELDLKNIQYGVDGLEFLLITTNSGIHIKIFEDGLIVLNDSDVNEFSLFQDIEGLSNYYEKKLSPALTYLFSLGAPVPKELANIETVYPYFIVLNNATEIQIQALLSRTDKEEYFNFKNKNYDVVRGDKYYFINNKTKDSHQVERYIEEQIFIREFKGQLHRYLNLHRIIWEKIDEVKESSSVRGKDIITFSNKIDGYRKTVNLIDSRINQMNTYIKTREKIAKNDNDLVESLDLIGYRYETLINTVSYMQQIWAMTKNYLNQAAGLFDDLKSSITEKSVNSLTIVTSMGVGASLIELFTESAPSFSSFGVIYFFILAIVGYSVNKIMKKISENRKYEIADIEYDKNIK